MTRQFTEEEWLRLERYWLDLYNWWDKNYKTLSPKNRHRGKILLNELSNILKIHDDMRFKKRFGVRNDI